jgi:CelD/BcsL family acetyltransferase involved in cellulose biosynthesis
MRVETISTAEGFAGLREGWDELAGRAQSPSAFLHYAWFAAAWEWRRDDAELRILVARDGDDIEAILPLIALRRTRRLRRVWTLLTVPDTQCCDLVVRGTCAVPTLQALAQALASRRDWDVLLLDYLDETSVLATRFVQELIRSRLRASVEDRGRNLYVPLTGTWTEYWSKRSRSVKKACNLAANRLQRTGVVRIERCGPGPIDDATCERALAAVIEVSAKSWKKATGNSLDHVGPGRFIRALTLSARHQGWLSMWIAYLDERPVAMEYQLVHGGNVHALRADFDAVLEQVSPGSYLFRQLLERLFHDAAQFQDGAAQYLMGPGDNAYKMRWTSDGHPLRRVTVYNRTPSGWLAWIFDQRAKPVLKATRTRLRRVRKDMDKTDDSGSTKH